MKATDLFRAMIPANREMMRAMSFCRDKGLEHLAYDRSGPVVRIAQMDPVTYSALSPGPKDC